jgi:hypothetical protein
MKLRRQLPVWIVVGSGLVVLFAFLLFRTQQVAPLSTTNFRLRPSFIQAFVPLPPQHRVYYPYSVIPGGVASPAELETLIKHDPEIAQHFEDFDLKKVELVKVARPRSVYVSYRVGNLIFWTTRKLTLQKGELLLTDGTRTIRSRCGNDVSETPKEPTSPGEPTTAELETPLPPSVVAHPSGSLLPPSLTELPPDIIFSTSAPAPPPGNGAATINSAPPFVPPIYAQDPSVPPPAPLIPTPEPSSLVLLSLGGAALAVRSTWGKVRSFKNKRPSRGRFD